MLYAGLNGRIVDRASTLPVEAAPNFIAELYFSDHVGDIRKIVDALRDYSQMLEMACVAWTLEGCHKLIEQCIERMINGTVEHFQNIREKTDGFAPFEKLTYLGNMTLDFLFEHYAVSKISILTDMQE